MDIIRLPICNLHDCQKSSRLMIVTVGTSGCVRDTFCNIVREIQSVSQHFTTDLYIRWSQIQSVSDDGPPVCIAAAVPEFTNIFDSFFFHKIIKAFLCFQIRYFPCVFQSSGIFTHEFFNMLDIRCRTFFENEIHCFQNSFIRNGRLVFILISGSYRMLYNLTFHDIKKILFSG